MKNGKREILIGAVGLVKGRVRDDGKVMVATCDVLEPEFEATRYLESAPFDVISLIFRYGMKWGTETEIGRINRHKELEVAVELPMSEVRAMNFDVLFETIMGATLQALISVGKKYDLPIERWNELLGARSGST